MEKLFPDLLFSYEFDLDIQSTYNSVIRLLTWEG